MRGKYEKPTAKTPRSFQLPAWLFVMLMVLYNELMLHIWITEQFQFGRLVVVAVLALAFGGVLAVITSLFKSPKAGKILSMVLSFLVVVLYLTEYFLADAYRNFMPFKTIIAGAGGVAQDYFDLVMSLLMHDLWRIGLMLLPIVVYGVWGRNGKTSWKLRGILAGATVVLYLLGIGGIHVLTSDADILGKAYDFDSAVRVFGLNMAIALDTMESAAAEEAPEFVAAPPTEPAVEEEEEVPQETQPIEYGDNALELDYLGLAETVNNSTIASLYQYVGSQTPSKKNEYTGLFEGKNLIFITAEAFSAEIIDPEMTPTLYRLANEGIRFEEYYQPAWGASTTTGEFSNLMGIMPTGGGGSMFEVVEQDFFLNIGKQLQKQNYTSVAYHNHLHDFYSRHLTHTSLGYDKFIARGNGMETGITPVWPESDLEMIDLTVPQYIDQQPFSVYYMTVSGHCLYTQEQNAMTRKNWDLVQHLNHSDTVKGYYAANLELEFAMESLVRQLEEAGIADDTVIVLATDHYPYGLERSSTWKNTVDHLAELYGVENYDKFMRDHNALIIWSGCIEDMDIVVEEPVYSLDILPTISNLFGVPFDSRLLIGRDVLGDTEPLVLWPDHSWLTDKGAYDAREKKYIAWDGGELDEAYIAYIKDVVANKITYSRSVQNADFFNHVSGQLAKLENTEN